MALITPKPASHARACLGLYSERVVIDSVASGGTNLLSITTHTSHGWSTGMTIYLHFTSVYTSGWYLATTGTTGTTLVVAGSYSSTTTGYAVKGLNIPLYAGVKYDHEATDIAYDRLRDNRFVGVNAKSLRFATLGHSMPLFLPRDGAEVTTLVALYDKILLPAGYSKSGSTLITYTMGSDFLGYDQVFAAYEEVLDRETLVLGATEFGLVLDTANGCWVQPIETKGQDGGTAAVAAALAYADIDGDDSVSVFQNANFKIGPTTGFLTDVPAIKRFTFKNGNEIALRDDGSSDGGVAGFLVGNTLKAQTVEIDLEMPAAHASFPFVTYFTQGTVLKYQLTMFGTVAGGYGIQIVGQFQIRNKVDRGERNGIRTIKVSGVSCQVATTDVPFSFSVGAGISA
jgi:hypothetical protein